MRGDRVEIVVDAGDGSRTYEISASRAGRRVEVSIARGVVQVVEVTRTGTPVRTARFMSSRVLALVEHPVDRERAEESAQAGEGRSVPVRAGPPGAH
jgi:hypothetical protein